MAKKKKKAARKTTAKKRTTKKAGEVLIVQSKFKDALKSHGVNVGFVRPCGSGTAGICSGCPCSSTT
ncbi:MAG: hypothetical protein AAF203_00665, partial [Pseudomonadota bacterium]